MDILFRKTIEQCRQLGARGGRAHARNLRLHKPQAPLPPVAEIPGPPSETAHEASLRLEKTEKVLKQAGIDSGPEKPAVSDPQARGGKRKARGHGRNGAAAYSGAQKIPVPHALLKAGDPCPDSCGGKIYPQREPGVLVRIKVDGDVQCRASSGGYRDSTKTKAVSFGP